MIRLSIAAGLIALVVIIALIVRASIKDPVVQVRVVSYTQVSTLAGTVVQGHQNGLLAEATFNLPNGIAVDKDNSIYVADTNNNVIRKLTPGGGVVDYAGSGEILGPTIGSALQVSIHHPNSLKFDYLGNLFISDNEKHLVRMVSKSGQVTLAAGNGQYGYLGGVYQQSSFGNPNGIAIDTARNLIVCDTSNNLLRYIRPFLSVELYSGFLTASQVNGPRIQSGYRKPIGIVLDSRKNMYIADSGNNVIRKIFPNGTVITWAGTSEAGHLDGPANAAKFNTPSGLALDAFGNLYVADSKNNAIRKISMQGNVTTYAGSTKEGYKDGLGGLAMFNFPKALAFDSNGDLLVTDSNNNMIRKIVAL